MTTASLVAAIVFLVVALMHLIRLICKTKVTIGKKVMPMWASVLGFIIPLLLAIWLFMS